MAQTGPSPVDRAKTGSKHHVITDGAGVPLAVRLTGGNRHDVTHLLPLIEAIPPVRGRPRRRPKQLYADRAYDHDKYRRQVTAKGITPYIAPDLPAHAQTPEPVQQGDGLFDDPAVRAEAGAVRDASAATTSTKPS